MSQVSHFAKILGPLVWVAVCGASCGAPFTTGPSSNDASTEAGADASEAEACAPAKCPTLGWQCGTGPDSCGGTLDCGACKRANAVCGPDHACHCIAITCASVGAQCGTIPDGCGGTESCGTCDAGTCGGGGGFLKCGSAACQPKTCADQGAECGDIADGCGGVVHCTDTCVSPQACGGGGVANHCGCAPQTCANLGWACGTGSDGCGGTLACGSCIGGTCNASSHACTCTPTATCKSLGYSCGSMVDSCNSVEACGAVPKDVGSLGNTCTDKAHPKYYECLCGALTGDTQSGTPVRLDAGSTCAGPTPPEPGWNCVPAAGAPTAGASAWCCAQ